MALSFSCSTNVILADGCSVENMSDRKSTLIWTV